MPNLLNRFLVLLLVPCLVLSESQGLSAADFGQQQAVLRAASGESPFFTREAFASRALPFLRTPFGRHLFSIETVGLAAFLIHGPHLGIRHALFALLSWGLIAGVHLTGNGAPEPVRLALPGWDGWGVQFSEEFIRNVRDYRDQQKDIRRMVLKIRDRISNVSDLGHVFGMTGPRSRGIYRVPSGNFRLYFTLTSDRTVILLAFRTKQETKSGDGSTDREFLDTLAGYMTRIESEEEKVQEAVSQLRLREETSEENGVHPLVQWLLHGEMANAHMQMVVFQSFLKCRTLSDATALLEANLKHPTTREIQVNCSKLVYRFQKANWNSEVMLRELVKGISLSAAEVENLRATLLSWMQEWLRTEGHLKQLLAQAFESDVLPAPETLWPIYYQLRSPALRADITQDLDGWILREYSTATMERREALLPVLAHFRDVLGNAGEITDVDPFFSETLENILSPEPPPAVTEEATPAAPVTSPIPEPLRPPQSVPPPTRPTEASPSKEKLPISGPEGWEAAFRQVALSEDFKIPESKLTPENLIALLAIAGNAGSVTERVKALKALLDGLGWSRDQKTVRRLLDRLGEKLRLLGSGESPESSSRPKTNPEIETAVRTWRDNVFAPLWWDANMRKDASRFFHMSLREVIDAADETVRLLGFNKESRVLEIGPGGTGLYGIAALQGSRVLYVQEEVGDEKSYNFLHDDSIRAVAEHMNKPIDFVKDSRELYGLALHFSGLRHLISVDNLHQMGKDVNALVREAGGTTEGIAGHTGSRRTRQSVLNYHDINGKFTHILMTDVIGVKALRDAEYMIHDEDIHQTFRLIAKVADPAGTKILFSLADPTFMMDSPAADRILAYLQDALLEQHLIIRSVRRVAVPSSFGNRRGYLYEVSGPQREPPVAPSKSEGDSGTKLNSPWISTIAAIALTVTARLLGVHDLMPHAVAWWHGLSAGQQWVPVMTFLSSLVAFPVALLSVPFDPEDSAKFVHHHQDRLEELSDRYAVVLRGRFLEGKLLRVLGDELHITKGGVITLQRNALKRLHALVESGEPSDLKFVRDHQDRLGELWIRHAEVLRGYFLEGTSLKVLASELQITDGSVGKLIKTALKRLRALVDPNGLAKFVRDHQDQLGRLKNRHAMLLRGRYLEGKVLRVLEDELHITRASIIASMKTSLKRLRALAEQIPPPAAPPKPEGDTGAQLNIPWVAAIAAIALTAVWWHGLASGSHHAFAANLASFLPFPFALLRAPNEEVPQGGSGGADPPDSSQLFMKDSIKDHQLIEILRDLTAQLRQPSWRDMSLYLSIEARLPPKIQLLLANGIADYFRLPIVQSSKDERVLNRAERNAFPSLLATGLVILEILKSQPLDDAVYQEWDKAIAVYNGSHSPAMSMTTILSHGLSAFFMSEGGDYEEYFSLLDSLQRLPPAIADRVIPLQLMQLALHDPDKPFDIKATERLLSAAFERLKEISDDSIKARYQMAIAMVVHSGYYQTDSVLEIIDRSHARASILSWVQTLQQFELAGHFQLSQRAVNGFGTRAIRGFGRGFEDLLLETADQIMRSGTLDNEHRQSLESLHLDVFEVTRDRERNYEQIARWLEAPVGPPKPEGDSGPQLNSPLLATIVAIALAAVAGLLGGHYLTPQAVAWWHGLSVGQRWVSIPTLATLLVSLVANLRISHDDTPAAAGDPTAQPARRRIIRVFTISARPDSWEKTNYMEQKLLEDIAKNDFKHPLLTIGHRHVHINSRTTRTYGTINIGHGKLDNAIENAVEAIIAQFLKTGQGYKGRIAVSILEAADGGLEVKIVDNGVGISEILARKLFIDVGKKVTTKGLGTELGNYSTGGAGAAVFSDYYGMVKNDHAEITIETRDEFGSRQVSIGPDNPKQMLKTEERFLPIIEPADRPERGTTLLIRFPRPAAQAKSDKTILSMSLAMFAAPVLLWLAKWAGVEIPSPLLTLFITASVMWLVWYIQDHPFYLHTELQSSQHPEAVAA